MATLGNTTTPTYGWDSYLSTANQAAEAYTVPAGGGIFSSVSFYASGDGGTANVAYGCIWDSSGNLLAHGSGVSTSGGSGAAGAQAWHTDTLTAPLTVAGGTTIYIGWQRSTASTFDWSFANDGAAVSYHTAGNTPSNFGTGVSVQNGSIGAYGTYTVNTGQKVYVRRSGSWIQVGTVRVRRSGAWVTATAKVRRSGAWVTL